MATESLIETIKRELPGLLRADPELRHYVIELTRGLYADRAETESRFDRLLEELRRDREEQTRRWDENSRKWEESTREQNRKWEENNRKWEESNRKWEESTREQNRKWEENNRKWDESTREQNRKWEENNRKWDESTREQNRKWEENNRKWDEGTREQNRKWDESRREFDRVHEEIMAQAKKFDRSIGALGSRWGLQSEAAFRNALAGILAESFGVTVANVCELDETGEVFGRPDQVELDIVVKNGLLLILELRSSIDKAGMYIFERKARFYERRHERKANRLIVVSPMIDPKAQAVARALGIETYSDSIEVPVD